MTGNGKIARLPRDIRNELNSRLSGGEPGIRLVEWLNGLPEVKEVLAAQFRGRPINEQNLCKWKQRGHQEWLARQEMLACARELAGEAAELSEAAEGSLADNLSVVLSARYAALVAGWDGEMDEGFRRKLRGLRSLCQDVAELRRGDYYAERLRLDLERFAQANKAASLRALETVLDETKQWPEVRKAFQDAFALYRQRNDRAAVARTPPHPDQDQSN